MARRLRHRDLQALSNSIRLLYRSCELESFPKHVFAAVAPLVRCDYFAYNEFAPDGALKLAHCEPGLPAAATEFLLALGPDFSKEHPTVSHVARTGSPAALQDYRLHDATAVAANAALSRIFPATGVRIPDGLRVHGRQTGRWRSLLIAGGATTPTKTGSYWNCSGRTSCKRTRTRRGSRV